MKKYDGYVSLKPRYTRSVVPIIIIIVLSREGSSDCWFITAEIVASVYPPTVMHELWKLYNANGPV